MPRSNSNGPDSPSSSSTTPVSSVSSNAAFEPYTLAAALAYATDRLGVAVTSSTTGGLHPYHAARRLASIDHLSGGRAAWLVGDDPDRAHAAEYVDVVRALWDSWDDDAFVRDVDDGRYYDPAGLHTPQYDGVALPGARSRSTSPAHRRAIRVVIHDLTSSAGEVDRSAPDLDADVVVVATPDQRIERLRRPPDRARAHSVIDVDVLVEWQRDGVVDGALIDGAWTTDHVRDLIALATASAISDRGRVRRAVVCGIGWALPAHRARSPLGERAS